MDYLLHKTWKCFQLRTCLFWGWIFVQGTSLLCSKLRGLFGHVKSLTLKLVMYLPRRTLKTERLYYYCFYAVCGNSLFGVWDSQSIRKDVNKIIHFWFQNYLTKFVLIYLIYFYVLCYTTTYIQGVPEKTLR